MSDIGISYSASTQPPQITARVGLRFENTTLVASIRDVDPFIVTLTPSGGVSEQILSGVAWPLAQTLGVILPTTIKGLFNGYSFPFMDVAPASANVLGETLTVSPTGMNLTGWNGQMLVSGTLDVR
jgi:hypothetical protein